MSRVQFLVSLAGVIGVVLAFGSGGTAWALPVDPGFDLLHTPDGGAFVDFTGTPLDPLGVVPLTGDPLFNGFGNTDTIVERLGPSIPPGGTGVIDAEIVSLNLVSVDPVPVSTSFFDVFVTLDPANTSSGSITLTSHDDGNGGGTFDSFFDVFVQVNLVDVTNPSNTIGPIFVQDQISSTGSVWSHSPPLGYPDPPGFDAGNFYPGVDPITGDVIGLHHDGPHPETFPATPEPSSLVLLSLGGLALLRRRRS